MDRSKVNFQLVLDHTKSQSAVVSRIPDVLSFKLHALRKIVVILRGIIAANTSRFEETTKNRVQQVQHLYDNPLHAVGIENYHSANNLLEQNCTHRGSQTSARASFSLR